MVITSAAAFHERHYRIPAKTRIAAIAAALVVLVFNVVLVAEPAVFLCSSLRTTSSASVEIQVPHSGHLVRLVSGLGVANGEIG
ncbi:hypothetical protein DLM46_25365 [Paraburkholderia lacunae]|uniref:Uncharacterized protein n=2 Tax=Paraburkholderia lacunae TaxID=2211104 RepID=A0A370N356_9BURK|nr:hypothetical protein DLM46_25365 [Paraburkholderia lacunae]